MVILLSAPSPQLATVWSSYKSPIIPKHVFDGTDLLANKAATAPIGTGPFRFKEWARGDHLIMERNPDYWDTGKPYLDRIVFRFIADAGSRTAALEPGEAQIGCLTPVPLSDMARLTAGKDLVATTDGYDYMAPVLLLQLNTRKPPLSDRAVRQAIAYAINRDVLTKTVWFGFGKPATGPIPSMVKAWYTTAACRPIRTTPKRPKSLLDAAGLTRGADASGSKCRPMPFRGAPSSPVRRSSPNSNWAASASMWRSAPATCPATSAASTAITSSNSTSMYHGAFPDPSAGIQRMYWSEAAQKGVPFVNPTGYSDPAVDHDFEDAQTQEQPEELCRAAPWHHRRCCPIGVAWWPATPGSRRRPRRCWPRR